MRKGYLSQYFVAVAAKRLSAVEADPRISNQREFNGTVALQKALGIEPPNKARFPTRFLWFGNQNESIPGCDGQISLYDARAANPSRSEYRLYYTPNDVMQRAQAGDLVLIARRTDGTVMIIVTVAGSTIENQLLWLFGLSDQNETFSLQATREEDREVDFIVLSVLDELGVEVEEPETDQMDSLLEQFKGVFPTTKEFSKLTRSALKNLDPLSEPDETLMAWMGFEEKLFRRMERHQVSGRIKDGFMNSDGADVDGFVSFSLSIQNRRKSRAGLALENHMEEIFRIHGISYSIRKETEKKAKPDFIFPSVQAYHDSNFPDVLLNVLGVKTSCKDRWRQVLSEADRIGKKHLLTLEPSISENQTNEMKANNLQLILPEAIHETYQKNQQEWLMKISDFITIVKEKQKSRFI